MFKKILSLSLIAVALLASAIIPASAESAAEPSVWSKYFPSGLIKAGQKSKAVKPENLELLDGKFVAVYRSAGWCGPCCRFTPKLVKFYKKNKDYLEIVFWSSDRTESEMIRYAKKGKMKWLAVPFGSKASVRSGSGIPGLTLISPEGEQGFTLTGCDATLELIQKRIDEYKSKKGE